MTEREVKMIFREIKALAERATARTLEEDDLDMSFSAGMFAAIVSTCITAVEAIDSGSAQAPLQILFKAES